MNPKNAACLFALGLSLLMLGACKKAPITPTLPTFAKTELTKEDIISLYKVPVGEKPYLKYEWTFDKPSYVRLVIERKTSGNPNWIVYQTCAENTPTQKYILYYNLTWEIDWSDSKNSQNPKTFKSHWLLKTVRAQVDEQKIFNGVSRTVSSRDFNAILQVDGETIGSSVQIPPQTTPEMLTEFTAAKTSYRIRLERSNVSFPKGSTEINSPNLP